MIGPVQKKLRTLIIYGALQVCQQHIDVHQLDPR